MWLIYIWFNITARLWKKTSGLITYYQRMTVQYEYTKKLYKIFYIIIFDRKSVDDYVCLSEFRR
jgi:hypothetical protein